MLVRRGPIPIVMINISIIILLLLLIRQECNAVRRPIYNCISNRRLSDVPTNPGHIDNFETFFDNENKFIAHRNTDKKLCFIQKALLNSSPAMARIKSRCLSSLQLKHFAGKKIHDFCKGYKALLVGSAASASASSNDVTDNMRVRRNAASLPNGPPSRGRYRGQTQSQYLNFNGNATPPGRAEAESSPSGSRAVVSGNNGMGQAQSQSGFSAGCEDCYGQPSYGGLYKTPRGQVSTGGKYYPGTETVEHPNDKFKPYYPPAIDSQTSGKYPGGREDGSYSRGDPVPGKYSQEPSKPYGTTSDSKQTGGDSGRYLPTDKFTTQGSHTPSGAGQDWHPSGTGIKPGFEKVDFYRTGPQPPGQHHPPGAYTPESVQIPNSYQSGSDGRQTPYQSGGGTSPQAGQHPGYQGGTQPHGTYQAGGTQQLPTGYQQLPQGSYQGSPNTYQGGTHIPSSIYGRNGQEGPRSGGGIQQPNGVYQGGSQTGPQGSYQGGGQYPSGTYTGSQQTQIPQGGQIPRTYQGGHGQQFPQNIYQEGQIPSGAHQETIQQGLKGTYQGSQQVPQGIYQGGTQTPSGTYQGRTQQGPHGTYQGGTETPSETYQGSDQQHAYNGGFQPTYLGGSQQGTIPSASNQLSPGRTQQISSGTYQGGTQQIPEGTYQGGTQVPGGTYQGGTQQPGGTQQIPGGTQQIPGGTYQGGTQQIPGSTYQSSTQVPGGTYQGSTQQVPGGTYQGGTQNIPGGTYQGGTQVPGGIYQGATQQPGSTLQVPGDTYHGGTQQQGGTQQIPGGTYQGGTQQIPGRTYLGGTQVPGGYQGGTQQPVGTQQIPGSIYQGGTQQPGGTQHIPGGIYQGGTQQPGGTQQIPGGIYQGGTQVPGGTYQGGTLIPGVTYQRGTQQPGGTQLPGVTYQGGIQPAPGGTYQGRTQQVPGGTYQGETQLPGGTQQIPGGVYQGGTQLPGDTQIAGGTYQSGTQKIPGGTQVPGGTQQLPGITYQVPGGTYHGGIQSTPGGAPQPGGTQVVPGNLYQGGSHVPVGTQQVPGGYQNGVQQVPGGVYQGGIQQVPPGSYQGSTQQVPEGAQQGQQQIPHGIYHQGSYPGGEQVHQIHGASPEMPSTPFGNYIPKDSNRPLPPAHVYGRGGATHDIQTPVLYPTNTGQYSPYGKDDGNLRYNNLNGQDSLGYPPSQSHVTQQWDGQSPAVSQYNTDRQHGQGVNGTSVDIDDDDDSNSQAQTSITQLQNGTFASSSATGAFGGGSAQTQVSGTYSGSGAFSAQAQTIEANRGAQSQINAGEKGITSSAQGRGGRGQSQVQMQLGPEMGETIADAQTSGVNHGTNTQVKASSKGGLADAQASGPGSTSSQAQIGFLPQDSEYEEDKSKVPFYGGGQVSAQSGKYQGQSQAQIQGRFKYGISYTGAAQAGSGTIKDGSSGNGSSLKPLNLFGNNLRIDRDTTVKPQKINTTEEPPKDVFEESESKFYNNIQVPLENDKSVIDDNDNNNKLKNYNENMDYASSYSMDQKQINSVKGDTIDSYDKSMKVIPNTEYYEDSEEDDYDGDFYQSTEATHQELNRPREVVIQQNGHGQKQHILLGSVNKNGLQIVKDSVNNIKEGMVFQPGEEIPGTHGYTIPIGFRGRVSSVSAGDGTYAYADENGESQAQTVTLTPGNGNVTYEEPRHRNRNAVRSWTAPNSRRDSRINNNNLRSNYKHENPNNYVTVTKTITGQLNEDKTGLVEDKKFSHTYYTKSSTCGYFTFTCNLVYGSNGRTRICKPKVPTNPDGTPMNC